MHSESSGSNVVRGFFWVHSRVAESESESESARVGGFWVVGVGVGRPEISGVGVGKNSSDSATLIKHDLMLINKENLKVSLIDVAISWDIRVMEKTTKR